MTYFKQKVTQLQAKTGIYTENQYSCVTKPRKTVTAPNQKTCLYTTNTNHGYYAHHGFVMVAEFKSDEWKTDSDDYLTYIDRKAF